MLISILGQLRAAPTRDLSGTDDATASRTTRSDRPFRGSRWLVALAHATRGNPNAHAPTAERSHRPHGGNQLQPC
jgi:hypothetical protein